MRWINGNGRRMLRAFHPECPHAAFLDCRRYPPRPRGAPWASHGRPNGCPVGRPACRAKSGLLPGLLLTSAAAAAAYGVRRILGLDSFSPMIIAILLSIALAQYDSRERLAL